MYAKPAGGGMFGQNPGCPDCGYLGWADTGASFTESWTPPRPTRVASGTHPADDADAAEVVVASTASA